MTWEGVVEFCAVASTGSFTAAATKLDTSGAQISRKVANVEKRLGVKLFNRTTRSVSLTQAGYVYFEQCQPALKALEEAELNVSQLQKVPQGLIKLTVPVAFGEAFIAPLINQFLKKYEGIEVECRFTNDTMDIIDEGFDLAIRIGNLEDSTMVAKKLATRQLYVCASPEYLNAYPALESTDMLSEHQCLVGSQPHWRFHYNGQVQTVRVKGRVKYNSGNALHHAALAGLGLVQLPGFYVRDSLAAGKLIEVLSPYRDKREAVWALFPSNRHLVPKIRLLVDFLSAHLLDDK
ncbi:LysR substrate-binding domain-containing protein [Alteromonas sp. 1_MG-2023]|uniref:LysR substrate-binding domain-containing protein n=1 Tax=Alteromonas sp. 1_MG-2023 TaxID=3062669 RepID=UPI0026E3BF8A|nr:LysR substrate-binding domain-containing protein [Alteromonas sp. 1_MG-2023]MDO6568368.1 LysR substrate-binding domain-containing protein [Alteromonas sp. 1_MG-2023]